MGQKNTSSYLLDSSDNRTNDIKWGGYLYNYISKNRYQIIRKLKDAYDGYICQAMLLNSSEVINRESKLSIKAVKSSRNTDMERKLQNPVNEIQIMQLIQNQPNIINLLETSFNGNYYFMVMPYFEFELDEYIYYGSNMNEEKVRNLAQQLLEGLKALHQRGIAHRDLKPDNIMFNLCPTTENPIDYTIIDFGLAVQCPIKPEFENSPLDDLDSNSYQKVSFQMCGSYEYMAPEIKNSSDESKENLLIADVWSLGVIIYFSLTGREYDMELGKINWDYLNREDPVSQKCEHFLRMVLNPNPDERPTVKMMLAHEWLQA